MPSRTSPRNRPTGRRAKWTPKTSQPGRSARSCATSSQPPRTLPRSSPPRPTARRSSGSARPDHGPGVGCRRPPPPGHLGQRAPAQRRQRLPESVDNQTTVPHAFFGPFPHCLAPLPGLPRRRPHKPDQGTKGASRLSGLTLSRRDEYPFTGRHSSPTPPVRSKSARRPAHRSARPACRRAV